MLVVYTITRILSPATLRKLVAQDSQRAQQFWMRTVHGVARNEIRVFCTKMSQQTELAGARQMLVDHQSGVFLQPLTSIRALDTWVLGPAGNLSVFYFAVKVTTAIHS